METIIAINKQILSIRDDPNDQPLLWYTRECLFLIIDTIDWETISQQECLVNIEKDTESGYENAIIIDLKIF